MNDYNIPECPVTMKEVAMKEANPVEETPIAAIMDKATVLSEDALGMVRRLKGYLFGMQIPDRKDDSPICYRDALARHTITLEWLCNELADIIKGLGA